MQDQAVTIRRCAITFLVLTWGTLLVRCWVRLRMIKSFGWDDKLMIVAQLVFTCLAAIGYQNTYHGIGTHIYESTLAYISRSLKLLFFDELLYSLDGTLTKISVTVFLLRIVVRPAHRYILYTTLTVGVIWATAFFLSILFQCWPVSYYWDKLQHGKCVSTAVTVDFAYANSAIAITTDFTLAILPIFIVRDLQMNKRTKVAVSVVLAMGTMASIATVVRIPYIHLLASSEDFLYNMYGIVLWSLLEPGIGITAANLATLRPLLQVVTKMRTRTGTTSKFSRDPSTGYSHKRSNHSEKGSDNLSQTSKDANDSSNLLPSSTKEGLIISKTYDIEMNAHSVAADHTLHTTGDAKHSGPTDGRW